MSIFNLQSLDIHNFRSIRHQNFILKDGLFVIVGDNRDNPGNNNGAGKTSIISAFFWALTGTSLNGEVLADEVINLKTGKDCKVTCIFNTDQGELKVTRTRKDSELGNSLSVILNDIDLSCHKISDTQERINQIIKVPFELLKSTIIMTSDMKSRFSDLTAQGRISLLESIRDYSIWSKIRDESKIDINNISSEIEDNTTIINKQSGSLDTYNTLIEKSKKDKIDLESNYDKTTITNKISDLKLENNQLQIDLNNIIIDESKIDTLKKEIEIKSTEKESLLLNNQQEIDKINNSFNETETNTKNLIDKYKNSLLEANSSKADLLLNQKTVKNNILDLENWFTNDTCPTCNRKLNRTEEDIKSNNQKLANFKQQATNIAVNLDTLDDTINEINGNIAKYQQDALEIIKNRENAVQEYKNSVKNRIESITNDVKNVQNSLNSEISAINQLKSKKDDISNQINKNNMSIMTYDNELNAYNDKIKGFDTQITSYTAEINKITEQVNKLKDLNEDLTAKKELFNYYYQELGPKGKLRPWLLSKDINYLNICIKKYVHKFFEDTDVYLTKPTLEDNSINIIVDCGHNIIKPVSSLSGGERKRVDLCIQLALYDLIKSTSLFNINFVCFDEIESALDGAGIRSLIDIIDERKDIIPTILWISNREEVIECIPDKIKVIKHNGFSEINYE